MKDSEKIKGMHKDVDMETVAGGIYTTEMRKERYKSELGKLKRSLKFADKKNLKLCDVLIKNLAFITVQMEELSIMVENKGYMMEYQNGANQKGIKKSVAADLYTVSVKNYSVLFTKLQSMLPKEETPKMDDMDKFIKKHK